MRERKSKSIQTDWKKRNKVASYWSQYQEYVADKLNDTLSGIIEDTLHRKSLDYDNQDDIEVLEAEYEAVELLRSQIMKLEFHAEKS